MRDRILGGGRSVPHWARNKWLAAVLLIVFFYAYERFSLWSSPWLTAWVVLGYFVAAFVVDIVFRGAAFCKYICPLGQFNFVGSLVSPLEVRVRTPETCVGCHTKDCITAGLPAGNRLVPRTLTRAGRHGCELWLFQERKVGNMDCTFCLDCVHACPHDNVGIIGRLPASELWVDASRSGVGRFSRRSDLAALVAVLVFAGFVNAFAMTRPGAGLRARLADWLGPASGEPALIAGFLLGIVALPALALVLTGLVSRRLAPDGRATLAETSRRVPVRSRASRFLHVAGSLQLPLPIRCAHGRACPAVLSV